MRTILLITLGLSGGFAKAQLNSTQFFPGSPKRAVEFSGVQPEAFQPGANQTWDFTSLTPNGAEYQVSVIPSATQFPEYPTATMAIKMQSDSSTGYLVLAPRNGSLEQVAMIYNKDGVQSNTDFTDPRLYLPSQLQFGQSLNDNYSSILDLGQQGMNAIFKSAGTSHVHADASGTILVPGHTYTNTLRVVTRDAQVDSMFLDIGMGFPPDTFITETRTISYNWYVNDGSGFPLAMSIVLDSSLSDGIWTVDTTAFYTTGITAVAGKENAIQKIRPAYPTHVDQFINLPLEPGEETPESISVYDLQGRVVGRYKPMIEKENEMKVNLGNLPPGQYHIKDYGRFGQRRRTVQMVKL